MFGIHQPLKVNKLSGDMPAFPVRWETADWWAAPTGLGGVLAGEEMHRNTNVANQRLI